ncbi:MAG: MFS transporter [Candidatus Poribacteria bacterium]|nr:MFS transporter [Candidatus Poribacteria bacterium]
MASSNFSRVSLILPIYLPALLLSTGAGIISPTLPIYIKSFELSYTLTTFVIAVGVVGNIPAGVLVERIGRKPAMLLGLVMIGFSAIGMGIAGNIWHLFGAQLVGGVGNALWMLSRHAYMADVIPLAKRGRSIALFGGVNRMGTFAGKFGAIFLGVNLRLPFFVYTAIAVLTLIICFFSIPGIKPELKAQSQKAHQPYLKQLLHVSKQHFKLLATAGIGQVCVQTLRRGCHIIIPLYANDVVGLSTRGVRSVEMISSAVDMSMFPVAGFMMDRFGRRYATVPGICIFATGMALMPFTDTFTWLLLAAIVMRFGNGIASGTMMTLGADLAPKEGTGEFLGLWRITGDFGGAAGPVVVGNIADWFGLGFSGFALGGIGYLAVGIFLWLVPETLQRE